MSITLTHILDLVGKLDDSRGDDTPRERFRRFLEENVREVGQVRDHIGECLRNKGDQYNRALQDLVNYLGAFLGFEVGFGRYQGRKGEVGFDGLWRSETGFHVVIEVKTTEAYAIKASTLVGYVDELISEKKIPDWGKALGLYVIGRPDPELHQIENAVIAEGRTQQLRIVSVDSLLSLAELMNDYEVDHEDVLGVLRPSGPNVDLSVGLMERLVAPAETEEEVEVLEDDVAYWLSSVKSDEEETAENIIDSLVRKEKIYAFGEKTPGRKQLKAGDWICFYASGRGVVAHAQVDAAPKNEPHQKVRHPKKYPWTFPLKNASLYLDSPIIIDADLRMSLDAFQNRDVNKTWGWLVIGTRRITKHDFGILTRR